MVKQLATIEEFDGVLRSSTQLVVVDFTATWCGPCKYIGPKFEAMSKDFANVASFVKVDVDENQEASAKCKVRCMPTFQLYKDGKKVDQMEGANEAELRKLVTKHANGAGGGEVDSHAESVEKPAAPAAACCV